SQEATELLNEHHRRVGPDPAYRTTAGDRGSAIAVLLFLITKMRLHAFLALVVVSVLTAFATGIPPAAPGGRGTC
ncbi:MAG: hypothetical protein ACRDQW_00365, partial [Haloechinothrix sp.]